MRHAIGIDVGGTHTRVALIDEQLCIIKQSIVSTQQFEVADDFLKQVALMVDEVDALRLADKIGVVLPAPWHARQEAITDITNVLYLEGLEISGFRSYFPNHTLSFENDVNVVALLETAHGVTSGLANVLYITVSTGVGSGMVLNGHLYHGAKGYAGEVGSMYILGTDETFESRCSGLALDAKSRKLYGKHADARALFEKYALGDSLAVDVIDVWLSQVADALASLIHILNPDVIILGGAVISHNAWVIEAIAPLVEKKVFAGLRGQTKVVCSHYGADSGVLGAANLVFELEE